MKGPSAFDDLARLDGIYDAAFDDSALEGLTKDFAGAFGARSSLVHWVHRDGSASVMSHSGYFSNDQLGRYARDFAAIDPWMSVTSTPALANQVHDLEKLVSHDEFKRSRFFEEFIAAMGDNTSRCLGVRLESPWGSGFVGLQRGSDQPRFEEQAVKSLTQYAPHLMRMLAIRGRLGNVTQFRADLSAVLDARGEPTWILRQDGFVLHLNQAAEVELARGSALMLRSGHLRARADHVQAKLLIALHTVTCGSGATAVPVPTSSGNMELSLTSLPNQNGQRHVLVVATDHRNTCLSRAQRLKALHGLSDAECEIVIALANGMSIAEIAYARQTAEGTVRFQVKVLANKLGCNRQSEIVGAVLRLPSLS